MTDAILSQFEFLDYRIERFHFSRQEVDDSGPYEIAIKFETRVHHNLDRGADTDAGSDELVESTVYLRIWLEWEPRPGPFELDIVIAGQFRRHADMPAQAYANFAEVLGPSILFSHARPIIKFMMSEAGEPFRLPLLNIAESIRLSREGHDEALTAESTDE